LSHLAALWQQPELLAEADALVGRLPDLIERDEVLDVIGGAAGCLGALLALDRYAPSAAALAAAVECGDRLLAPGQPQGPGQAWLTLIAAAKPLTGFAHGAAGMAWALLELTARTGEERFRATARAALTYERGRYCAAARNWPDLRTREQSGQVASGGPSFM